MMAATASRPRRARRNGFTIAQRSNLLVLLRVLYREHGSWIAVARAIRIRRATIEGFYHDDKPGSLALARTIAKATGIELETALEGRFVVTDKGIKPIGGAR